MLRHRPTSLVAFTVAGAGVVIATFLPWLRSGSGWRSSYDLLGLLDRLDLAPDGVISALIGWWPVVPLLVTVAVVSAWWGWRWAAFGSALVAVLYTGGVGTTLVVRSRGTGIGIGPGAWLCAAASAVFLVTAAWIVFTHASGRAVRTPPGALPADRS
ncbi:MAG: hypothetical protein AAB131_00490 [Actinomycetota bacterium]